LPPVVQKNYVSGQIPEFFSPRFFSLFGQSLGALFCDPSTVEWTEDSAGRPVFPDNGDRRELLSVAFEIFEAEHWRSIATHRCLLIIFRPSHGADAPALTLMQLRLQKLDWQTFSIGALLEDGDTALKLIVDKCVGQFDERLQVGAGNVQGAKPVN
jgi:hypothetical protein